MSELKACHVCARAPFKPSRIGDFWMIECHRDRSHTVIVYGDTPEEVTALWNRRAAAQGAVQLAEKLRDLADEMRGRVRGPGDGSWFRGRAAAYDDAAERVLELAAPTPAPSEERCRHVLVDGSVCGMAVGEHCGCHPFQAETK